VRTVNTKVKVLHCILGITRPGQKVSGLSSEVAVRHHCGAQGQSVPLNFYLVAMRRLHDAVRRNSQEIAVYLIFGITTHPLDLAQIVQPMLAKHHI